MRDIVLELFSGEYYNEDLAKLPASHRDLINAFLDEVEGSEEARWQMTKRIGEWYTPYFNVKAVESLQSQGYNIYRIRPLGSQLSRYRILYAYDAEYDEFYLLAVVGKATNSSFSDSGIYNFDYELTHPITVRICQEYDSCGLPRIC